MGPSILAEAGASEVIGVDNAEAIVEAVQRGLPRRVHVIHGDVSRLDLPSDSFDMVVCFEVIEHVQDTDAVLDELTRVLRPDGLLAISSPNRDTYPPGNPHHVHEFQPDELRKALQARFANVQIVRQHGFLTSAILDEDAFVADEGARLESVEVRKTVGSRQGEEAYTLALASDEELPASARTAVLSSTLEVREWLEHFDAQQRAFEGQANQVAELKRLVEERSLLIQKLEEAERRAAEQLNLMESLAHAEALLADTENRLRDTEQALEGVVGSPSWKLTAPLRGLKRLLGGARDPTS